MEHLLSVRKLAELTGWSPFTIYKKVAAGEIPGQVRIGKRSIRFREAVILSWLLRSEVDEPARRI